MNETIEVTGTLTRYLLFFIKRKYKPFKYFYDPFWKGEFSMNERLEINRKNRKVGFIVMLIFISLIYIGFFNLFIK